MKINFEKYQGAGNDFVMINGSEISGITNAHVKKICDRHFGVGADGLIVINKNETADFEMVYYNADGKIGSMCGNGARCAAIFALNKNIISSNIMNFKTSDGRHTAKIFPDGFVKVSMNDVREWKKQDEDYIINTGSPHYVKRVIELENLAVVKEGKKIRYNDEFSDEGINVNFFEEKGGQLSMRTYERGVENETMACGTGTVAVALINRMENGIPEQGKFEVPIKALGGDLKVTAEFANGFFRSIYLIGPVQKIYEGSIDI